MITEQERKEWAQLATDSKAIANDDRYDMPMTRSRMMFLAEAVEILLRENAELRNALAKQVK